MLRINERTTLILTVSFLDDAGDPVTPDAATYRIDDKLVKTEIKDTTTIGSLDESVEIEITSLENRILVGTHAKETRHVTVEFDYGVGRHGTSEYVYEIANLYGVTD